MRAIFETPFDIFYLLTVLSVGILLMNLFYAWLVWLAGGNRR